MKPDHVHLVAPLREVAIVDRPRPPPWWLAPEFLALAELRWTMVGGAVPSRPPETAGESARDAVFWVLFEVEHGEFNLRIVEHAEVTMQPPRGAR